MPDVAKQPLLTYQRRVRWRNKHLNVERQVERLYDVWNRWGDRTRPTNQVWRAGLSALQSIVREAERLNRRVRGLGGGWSLSEAATTNDFLVNTKPLNYIDVGLSASSCAQGFEGKPERLVFAQCGATVQELNQELESRGLALPTSGASNGQTIVGAISTGTHGAAHQVGAMQDFVVGLHVVAEGGEDYWIERASRPVASDAFLRLLGAKPIRSDELFNAALVSFGSFGLIHAVLLEVVPLYLLETWVHTLDFPRVERALATLDVAGLGLHDGSELPYHFEVVVNPYELGIGQGGAHVRALYKRELPAPDMPAPPLVSSTLGDDLLCALGGITDGVPALIPASVELVLAQQVKPARGVRASPGQTWSSSNMRGAVLSMELGVALTDVVPAIECVATVARDYSFAGVVAARYVKSSPALLAFTSQRFGDRVATLEIPCVGSERSLQAFERIYDALDRRGITHSFHWGQCMPGDYTRERLRSVFGDRVDRWQAARNTLLQTPAARRRFANGFIERLGLAD